MAGKPYSTRFLSHNLNGYGGIYTVPAAHRAVIKSMITNNGVNAPVNVIVLVNGGAVYTFSIPGYGGAVSQPFMYVLYAGETLQLFNGGNSISTSVHGYLLTDT